MTVYYNRLSCFACSPGEKCSHFHKGLLQYDKNLKITSSSIISTNLENETNLPSAKQKTKLINSIESSNHSANLKHSKQKTKNVTNKKDSSLSTSSNAS